MLGAIRSRTNDGIRRELAAFVIRAMRQAAAPPKPLLVPSRFRMHGFAGPHRQELQFARSLHTSILYRGEDSKKEGQSGSDRPAEEAQPARPASVRPKPQLPKSLRDSDVSASDLLTKVRDLAASGVAMLLRAPGMIARGLFSFAKLLLNPPKLWQWCKEAWSTVKHEAKHYYNGFRLLGLELGTSMSLIKRIVQGHSLTRRERRQLVRTTADLFRMVPIIVMLIIPFMELAIPLMLRVFGPSFLPSTFEDKHASLLYQKRELRVRLELAEHLQESFRDMVKDKMSKSDDDNGGSRALSEVLTRVRYGQGTPEDVVRVARLFKDDMTLDNLERVQLMVMSRYMGLSTVGPDSLLRYQLRTKIRNIKADDQQILWEGVGALSEEELRTACIERGMRGIGEDHEELQRQLREWVDLSTHKEVPTVMLILSRALSLAGAEQRAAEVMTGGEEPLDSVIQQGISSLGENVTTEALLDVAKAGAKSEHEEARRLRELQLESLAAQNELIEAEREAERERVAAAEHLKQLEEQQEQLAAAGRKELPPPALAAVQQAQQTAAAAEEAVEEAAARAAQATAAEERAREAAGQPALHMTLQGEMSDDELVHAARQAVEVVRDTSSDLLEGGVEQPVLEALGERELEALQLLASESVVAAEEKLLERLRGTRETIEAEEMMMKGRVEHQLAEAAEVADAVADAAVSSMEKKAAEARDTSRRSTAASSGGGVGEAADAAAGAGDAGEAEQSHLEPEPEVEPPAGLDLSRVRNTLDNVLQRLERQVADLGAKMGDAHKIDKDSDGVVSTAELKEAIVDILENGENATEKADAIVAEIDSDRDGAISVGELLAYADVRAAEQRARRTQNEPELEEADAARKEAAGEEDDEDDDEGSDSGFVSELDFGEDEPADEPARASGGRHAGSAAPVAAAAAGGGGGQRGMSTWAEADAELDPLEALLEPAAAPRRPRALRQLQLLRWQWACDEIDR